MQWTASEVARITRYVVANESCTIERIKALRGLLLGLGLREAKMLVDAASSDPVEVIANDILRRRRGGEE
jgi:ribosomal protein L7/L12